ncbi:TetR/AcrR family transcriptional regulator [Defluviimonas aestuarii]|uniref:TetR/AcrR family transcriptional regulator n=1 Tax=Albidovulum aestuarii TaxID=1130726 RepID=UPI00249CACC1|nr:TetR/AcrR family transcriptional regulator [Defluviimonas aestuarii]MDI3338841.1 TetR/AcrR family transcriptional regulator [Defluviimonas aestuarii]
MAQPKKKADRNLDRSSWVAAARKTLIEKGISGISLRQLAEELGATTGAFYWQFGNLEELLEEVRRDWADRNTAPFTEAIESAGDDGWQQYLAYVSVLLKEDQYVPAYDNAVRDWAHSSLRTAEVLRETEALRIEQLRRIFIALGFEGRAASVRAHVTYFSQTGYNAMQVTEPREERLLNVPYYADVLTDRQDLLRLKTAQDVSNHILADKRAKS